MIQISPQEMDSTAFLDADGLVVGLTDVGPSFDAWAFLAPDCPAIIIVLQRTSGTAEPLDWLPKKGSWELE
jgi:hypothetical protein